METGKVSQLKQEISRLRETLAEKDRELEDTKVNNLFLTTLFDGIHEEIMVIDANFVIQDVNRVYLERYDTKKEDVLGKKCHAVTYGSETPCVFAKGLCPLKKARETAQRVEVTHFHEMQGGEPRELVRIVYPLTIAGERPKYFVEISRDVTEYRQLITKLKASERKFRAILDTASDAILGVDKNHKIVIFNNAAERIFGYSRSEIIEKDLSKLIPNRYGDHHDFVTKFMERKSSKIMGKTLSLTALRKNGEEFPIELGLSYHETEGEIIFTALIRDVSGKKQMEKNLLQSERLAAVGQTVAHVAHGIRNPLMIIGGFSHQIKKSLTDEKTLQKLDMVLDEVSRLEKLVANLGDFTKEYELMKRPADINAVIRDVVRIIGEIYSPEKYKFAQQLTPDLPEISCDPDKLKQVFINIIANGIEAMEDGGTIEIITQKTVNGVDIHISDEGVGISSDDLDHIFEPFYTTRERGSGLGLSISYKIAAAHKGEISAVSKPGEGTTFTVKLPSR